jgi:DNA-binding response OmpR family regulator
LISIDHLFITGYAIEGHATRRLQNNETMLKRILVLDDNQDVLDVVKEVLLYEKFEVNITSNSKQFIEMVKAYRPDLVILEHKLNGHKGGDIYDKMKANTQSNNIPIILCSAYLNGNQGQLNSECDAVIAKPFGLDELIDKVNGLIGV